MSDYDALIVGAGAAGCLYAAELARAGKRVLVIEAGPERALSDLVSSQIWARRLKWGGAVTDFSGNHRGFSHNLNTGWGTGGAALHHYATWPRMHEELFRHRSVYGDGRDWPFDYSELAPFYDDIQTIVGIAGDSDKEIWRPKGAPYPMPPLPVTAQGARLRSGFARLGLPVAPLPVAVLTEDYGDRPACQYDGWCDAGCPTGALANPLVTFWPVAEANGAQIWHETTVLRLTSGADGAVSGVEWVRPDGSRGTVEAPLVVLATSAVQTPRLLLNSACEAWPQGAGNTHDQVGRNFMLDTLALVYGLFDGKLDNHLGVSAGQLTNRVRDRRDRPGAPPGSWQWQIAPAIKPNDIFGIAVSRAELFGTKLDKFMQQAATGLASMVAMIGQLPDPENRVVLSDADDDFGMKRAKVVHRADDRTMALWRHCLAEGGSVMAAAGAREHWAGPFNCGHLIGGTLMGDDAQTSVCDSHGRVHSVPGLVLSGSGVFPVSGGISPTFTLLAIALRSARALLRQQG